MQAHDKDGLTHFHCRKHQSISSHFKDTELLALHFLSFLLTYLLTYLFIYLSDPGHCSSPSMELHPQSGRVTFFFFFLQRHWDLYNLIEFLSLSFKIVWDNYKGKYGK